MEAARPASSPSAKPVHVTAAIDFGCPWCAVSIATVDPRHPVSNHSSSPTSHPACCSSTRTWTRCWLHVPLLCSMSFICPAFSFPAAMKCRRRRRPACSPLKYPEHYKATSSRAFAFWQILRYSPLCATASGFASPPSAERAMWNATHVRFLFPSRELYSFLCRPTYLSRLCACDPPHLHALSFASRYTSAYGHFMLIPISLHHILLLPTNGSSQYLPVISRAASQSVRFYTT